MNPDIKTEFDRYSFDELRDLYKKDPGQFDELAADAIDNACICRTEEKTLKCRQLQWRIDAQLRKASTPTGRMQIMENIFYNRIYGEEGELANLTENCIQLIRAATSIAPKEPAKKRLLTLVKR